MAAVASGKRRPNPVPAPASRARAGHAPMNGSPYAGDPRWQLVERIAESRSLGRSALLVDFLRYVCDRQMQGRADEVTEQRIGVKVFGRVEGYNSGDDNIVRNYARTLRKRLEIYFRSEGAEEPLLVVIPRGGYVPVFLPRGEPGTIEPLPAGVERGSVETQTPGEAEPELPGLSPSAAGSAINLAEARPSAARKRPAPAWVRPLALAGILLMLCAATGLLGFLAGRGRQSWLLFPSSAQRVGDRLWNSLFESDRDTFIVPADGGLVMMQSFTREKIALADYVNGNYRSPGEIQSGMQGLLRSTGADDQAMLTHKVAVLAARRYTSIVDLALAARLSRLRQALPERLVLRFARDLRIDDLRSGNAILLGSNDANPWVSLFEQQLNFRFAPGNQFGGSGTIVNTHPLPGELDRYGSATIGDASHTYGVIAYVPNLEGSGHVLLVEGVNMAGTQAAGDFLLNPDKMRPMLEFALDRHGKLQPFEILIETTSIAADASRARVVSRRIAGMPAH